MEFHVAALNSKFFSPFYVVVNLRVKQHRLGGDAAHIETGAAEAVVFFDHRRAQPPLCRANRGDVAARPAAHNDQVEFVSHNKTSRKRSTFRKFGRLQLAYCRAKTKQRADCSSFSPSQTSRLGTLSSAGPGYNYDMQPA